MAHQRNSKPIKEGHHLSLNERSKNYTGSNKYLALQPKRLYDFMKQQKPRYRKNTMFRAPLNMIVSDPARREPINDDFFDNNYFKYPPNDNCSSQNHSTDDKKYLSENPFIDYSESKNNVINGDTDYSFTCKSRLQRNFENLYGTSYLLPDRNIKTETNNSGHYEMFQTPKKNNMYVESPYSNEIIGERADITTDTTMWNSDESTPFTNTEDNSFTDYSLKMEASNYFEHNFISDKSKYGEPVIELF